MKAKKNTEKKLKFYNRLYFHIYLHFGIVIVVFAILTGLIYTKLYEKSTMSSYTKQATEQAKNIAQGMADLIEEDDKNGSADFMDFLETTENGSTTDVWFISRGRSMAKQFTNADLRDIPRSKELKKVIRRAWKGKTGYCLGYDEIYEMDILKVATPIFNSKGNVIGMVILNSFVESRQNVLDLSRQLILFSVLTALVVSFVIAIVLVRSLSQPISKMRLTALELARGNYNTKTKVKYANEIGSLAKSIDILSERLMENEEERKDMERMRMDFFSNVSHELRTPITVIRGYTESLVDGVVEEEDKKRKYYKKLLSECKSMERLVGDLLLLSKMQNPEFSIYREPVNVIQVWKDVLHSARAISIEKKISIQIQMPEQPYIVLGDYDRLKQMFMVIIDNAIKFSNENSNVDVEIKKEENQKIAIKIKDYGIGIKEEELPFIFEKFYKSKLRQNAKGSGLGLMIAKQIILKHNGWVTVKSKEGKGTEFIFYLEQWNESE